MNNEIEPTTPHSEATSNNLVKEPLPITRCDDDLDLMDVQLGPRQKSATEEIVCEGGCE
jgi:hypothetical protein